MDAAEKRQLENELTVMGLPGLDSPELVQAMADVVNAYPFPDERVGWFCDLLNECEGARRREMYEAMRPRLHFAVPSLTGCEEIIAAKAERMIRPRGMPAVAKKYELPQCSVQMECGGCGKTQVFEEFTSAGCVNVAHKAGWGRGPEVGKCYCPECRLATMPVKVFGDSFAKRLSSGY